MAADRNVSTNHVVSRALRRLGEYGQHADRFGFVSLSSKAFQQIVEHLSLEDARELGRDFGQKILPEFVFFTYKKFDYESVIQTMEMFGQSFGKMYVFDRSRDRNGIDTLIFKHSHGEKMSAYIAESMKALLTRLNLGTIVSQTDSQTVITVGTKLPNKQAMPILA
jgi:hypothetical protein